MTSSGIRNVCIAVALAASGGWAQAIGVVDAPADYVNGYAGSRKGDLDVIGAFVSYNPTTDRFVFSGTMNADIGLSTGGLYVWGVNRGTGTARFAGNGIDGVLFDAVVILRPDGGGTVSRLDPGGGTTSLAAGTALSAGSTILAQIDGSLLPGKGFAKTAYTWNLWPRDGTLPAGFGQIADFAPDNSNLGVTVLGQVPEPSSLVMMGVGLAALVGLRRRRPAGH